MKYINKNLYSECRVITALNAYHFLMKKPYCKQGDETYMELVDLCGAYIGSAIGVEKVHQKLGIKKRQGFSSLLLLDLWPKVRLPLEMNVWHKKMGFHSTLIVDYSIKCRAIQVANFPQVTSHEGWMFVEDVYQYVKHRVNCKGYFPFVFFGLRGKKYPKEEKELKVCDGRKE